MSAHYPYLILTKNNKFLNKILSFCYKNEKQDSPLLDGLDSGCPQSFKQKYIIELRQPSTKSAILKNIPRNGEKSATGEMLFSLLV